jgi:hypothetical protein
VSADNAVRIFGCRSDCAIPHGVKNQLAIVLGFCELVAGTFADDDPRRADMRQIEQAARTALNQLRGDDAFLPETRS